uniref:hypothetical protein n=1 Tax=Roseomonas sp. 18066 TaxID=2681412 RepID=UPI00190FBD2D
APVEPPHETATPDAPATLPQAAAPLPAPAPLPMPALAATPPRLSPGQKDDILRQAEEKLALGEVEAARRLYQQAAQGGSSQAAAALSRTYDPEFLRGLGAAGTPSDALLAMIWSRRAAALAALEPAEVAL